MSASYSRENDMGYGGSGPGAGPGSVDTTVLQEKRLRKAAEEDALRLYNRVRQLQREELKAAKRIEETKRRAHEVLSLRERNEQKARERELRLRELQVEVAKQRKANVRRKQITQQNKEEREMEIMEMKETLAQSVRVERALLEDELQREKILQKKRAVEQKEQIRRARIMAARKMEQKKMTELMQAHEDYERRVAEEMEARRQKERELQEMAQLELQLIEKLKHKQREQMAAYSELEDILGASLSKASLRPSARSTASRPAKDVSSLPPEPAAVEDANEPTEEEIALAFSTYDEEGTGTIPTTSLDGLMRDLGVPLDAAQLSQAAAQLDRSGSGEISFGEFLLWWRG